MVPPFGPNVPNVVESEGSISASAQTSGMTSMLYTVGTALSRAANNGLTVSVLVEGHWLEGQVAGNDGMGVVLEGLDGEHSVVRTERISAVKVHAASPYPRATPRPPIARGPEATFSGFGPAGAARPMPAGQPQPV